MMLVADNDDHHDNYDESVHLFHCALVPICASIACTHLDDHIHIFFFLFFYALAHLDDHIHILCMEKYGWW